MTVAEHTHPIVGRDVLLPSMTFYTGRRCPKRQFVYVGGGIQPDGTVRAVDVRGGARNIRVSDIVKVDRLRGEP